MDKVKAAFVAAFSMIFGWLGILAVPVLILAGLNFTDYITGILASKRRNELVTSDKGLWGIVKKIGMWILVGLGWAMDCLLYTSVSGICKKHEWRVPHIRAA